ncbi:MAG: alpha-amylase family glycosyl hydrolase [Anaerolineales bacterium]|jgi:glycosidase|nr:alpha-amylase family glycosyl hydrolase [Anaerolineales bacterium]
MKKLLPCLLLLALLAACAPAPAAPTEIPPTASPEISTPTTAQPGALTGLEPGWWNDAVFYQVFVRSFKDSDGNGVGDFNGITEMLDYLNDGDPATATDLGITALWLMPITESPSYHGYDVVDYYSVDSEYGTKEDFLRLVEQAHQRGIRIIIDLVLNHTGTGHPWFKASAAGDPGYRDWYIWADEKPTYLGPWGQPVWYAAQKGYYYAVFWSGMPDLNLENPQVNQEIYNITRFWLTDMNVDGFRLDAIRHFVEQGSAQENTPKTHKWLQDYFQFYKSLDPSVFTVGEAWTETAEVLDYIGDEVDIAFEFDLAEDFVRAANGPIASAASQQLKVVLENYPAGQYGVFLTNHDQNRTMSSLGGDFGKAKLAAVMLLTSPGVPFIYYGEEIGMTGTKPDEDIRLPMQWKASPPGVGFTTAKPWRAAAPDWPTTNVAAQDSDPDSLLNLYRTLIELRNNHPALRSGETLVIAPGSQRIYAILRYDQTEAFLVLINVHPNPQTAGLYGLSLASSPLREGMRVETVLGLADPSLPSLNANGGFENYQPFAELPAHSATILRFTWP